MSRHEFEISVVDPEEPYSGMIRDFLRSDFTSVSRTATDRLNDLTAALMATQQVRFGPLPNPESTVAIRKVLARAMESNLPVPVLVPWGSRKPDHTQSVDIAEVLALRQLQCLQDRVTKVHAPGINVVLRLEDLSGFYLFEDEGPEFRANSARYVKDMESLIHVLGLTTFVYPFREGENLNESKYAERVYLYEPMFLAYLQGKGDLEQLIEVGWKGNIAPEMREFYYSRYRKVNPTISLERCMQKLARYFATVLARVALFGVGRDGEYIKIYFAGPIPGTPEGLADRTIHYRTIPAKYCMTHVPPWRAHGYLKMEEGRIIPKLQAWGQPMPVVKACAFRFFDDIQSVNVKADYVL